MKNLAFLRKKRGLTQSELADKADVPMNSLARYERGEVQPAIEIANKIAKALNVTIDELLNGTESKDWEIKIKLAKEGVIDMTTGTSAELNVGDTGMAITISAGYDVWRDDTRWKNLLLDLEKKRIAVLKLHEEAF